MEKLNLTPEDILDKEFNVDFKGYTPSEVDAFLDDVLEDYQTMEDNVQQLLETIDSLQEEVKKLTAKNIELEVVGNVHLCIIGKNGVGKTTLLKRIYKE